MICGGGCQVDPARAPSNEHLHPHHTPLLLDLFCGAGGAAMGYHRAGFDVIGVDIKPQPNYPFPFIQGDAINPPVDLAAFDAIHASPPCQGFTQMSARWRGKGTKADTWPDLLTPTREWLTTCGKLYVIENVPGAIHAMNPTLTLHGGMFGLRVNRPRHFESNVLIMAGKAPRTKQPVGVYGKPDGRTVWRYRNNGNMKGKSLIRAWKSVAEGGEAMGIDWITDPGDWHSLAEAIPPAYTEHIGRQLIEAL